MNSYKVGFLLTRCYIQKPISLGPETQVTPLSPTGTKGDLICARDLLKAIGVPFSGTDLAIAIKLFQQSGQTVHLSLPNLEAQTYIAAIESSHLKMESAAGALSVISGNPVVPLCSYAESSTGTGSGKKFYIPNDRLIKHAINIPGFLDALPDLYNSALKEPKLQLLLRLYRASLREYEIDNQILFQLILFEEASDGESGSLAEKVRAFATAKNFLGDINSLAEELNFKLPPGKDVVDILVKLRNAAAHNGEITDKGLLEFNGGWVVPLILDKVNLHKLIGESIRYMFCALVGHSREKKAKEILIPNGGSFPIKFE